MEKKIVEIPEPVLSMSGEGGKSGFVCESVIPQGKVFKHDFYVSSIFFEHLLEEGVDSPAIGSLKITENGKDHSRIGRALERRPRYVDIVNEIDAGELDRADLTIDEDQCVLGGSDAYPVR